MSKFLYYNTQIQKRKRSKRFKKTVLVRKFIPYTGLIDHSENHLVKNEFLFDTGKNWFVNNDIQFGILEYQLVKNKTLFDNTENQISRIEIGIVTSGTEFDIDAN